MTDRTGSGANAAPIDRIELVGGRLAVDFVNTANWIADEPVDDRLLEDDALGRWAQRVGLDERMRGDTKVCADDLVSTRQLVRHALLTGVGNDDAVGDLVALLTGAGTDDLARHPVVTAVLYSAMELVAYDGRSRIRQCPGPRCGWLFVDDSPSGRRRWCTMESCGNRAKAKRHYQRSTTAQT